MLSIPAIVVVFAVLVIIMMMVVLFMMVFSIGKGLHRQRLRLARDLRRVGRRLAEDRLQLASVKPDSFAVGANFNLDAKFLRCAEPFTTNWTFHV